MPYFDKKYSLSEPHKAKSKIFMNPVQLKWSKVRLSYGFGLTSHLYSSNFCKNPKSRLVSSRKNDFGPYFRDFQKLPPVLYRLQTTKYLGTVGLYSLKPNIKYSKRDSDITGVIFGWQQVFPKNLGAFEPT